MAVKLAAFLALCTGVCSAQDWEIGAATGYGFVRNASIYAPAGKAAAGIRDRFILSFVLAEDRFEYIGGEFRYTYQDGDPFLSARGQQANVQGQSHAFHYDLLIHNRPHGAHLRFFAAAGIGVKRFVVTGPAPLEQPLPDIATVTTRDETKWLASVGLGVKWQVAPHVLVRADFRDYITPFPKRLLAPAENGTARGYLQQFTPMIGVSGVF